MNLKTTYLYLPLIFLLFIALGCKTEAEQTNKKNATTPMITQTSAVEKRAEVQPRMKPFALTFNDLIEKGRLNKLPTLTQKETATYFVEAIDENFTEEYKYHLVDEIVRATNGKMLLIAREYDNENTVWLCLYDKNHKILNAKEVYYDNAEGNYQVEANLKNDTLTLFMEDVSEGKYTEKYTFEKDFKIKQLKN
ncbi:hypothetical protein GVN20_07975 [Runella sp. CRIBMP]|uniref:hypothetical protein n=1 Tax=Runella sp. CRIBMP TaxID=2683261 RepID=UPI0014135379|nr:hypothetical protein [Runella sp. CRIBMP]NBB19289.1 hypothetical protein [Runella sp. CRIBMP]